MSLAEFSIVIPSEMVSSLHPNIQFLLSLFITKAKILLLCLTILMVSESPFKQALTG